MVQADAREIGNIRASHAGRSLFVSTVLHPMKIVVLDGYTLNPGDLNWQTLTDIDTCQIYERTPPAETLARAAGAEIVLTNKVILDREIIARLPDLRYIGVLATGINVVDVAAAKEHGIVVTNVPAYSTASVVQLTFALLLELTHHVGHHAGSVRGGGWVKSKDFAYWDFPLIELAGLKLGLVGFGAIAQGVARVAQALGMSVLATRRGDRPPEVPGVEMVDMETLFRQVNAARLALMKPTAYVLNTSRGPVINEADLADALNADKIAGAGLDVLSTEPPKADNPLLSAKNCLITPHIAWASRAARTRLLGVVAANIRAFLDGKPQNVVG